MRTGGKPEIRTKMHQIAMQHVQKENRQKPRVSAGFVAGAEGLGLGYRLGRFAAERHWRSLTPRHALRRAQPCLVAESLCALTKNREASIVLASLFLAGAEGLEPSARGFGVDVEERKRERGRGGVARFLLQDENVRCWFGAFRFSRSKTRIESPLEISLRMSSLKSYICMYTEE